MDMTKVSDEISNITKFFGDWHLARIYMGCAARFHLAEWENMVSQKLRALDGLYTMLQQDSTSRAMLLLDVAIVGLFVIDTGRHYPARSAVGPAASPANAEVLRREGHEVGGDRCRPD